MFSEKSYGVVSIACWNFAIRVVRRSARWRFLDVCCSCGSAMELSSLPFGVCVFSVSRGLIGRWSGLCSYWFFSSALVELSVSVTVLLRPPDCHLVDLEYILILLIMGPNFSFLISANFWSLGHCSQP